MARNNRGIGILYPEKKEVITAALTPTGRDGLDTLAESMKLSRSELMERIGRDKFVLFLKEDCDRVTVTVGIPCSEVLEKIGQGLLKITPNFDVTKQSS